MLADLEKLKVFSVFSHMVSYLCIRKFTAKIFPAGIFTKQLWSKIIDMVETFKSATVSRKISISERLESGMHL